MDDTTNASARVATALDPLKREIRIIWAQNPMRTAVELDEAQKRELWNRIKEEKLIEIMFEGYFNLKPEYFDLAKAREALDPKRYMDGGEKEIEDYVNESYAYYLEDLSGGWHVGDCTCVAGSCTKCHAESLIGVDTIKGLGKHQGHKVSAAFGGRDSDRSCDEAISHMEANPPKNTEGWHSPYMERWSREHKEALAWLKEYRRTRLLPETSALTAPLDSNKDQP